MRIVFIAITLVFVVAFASAQATCGTSTCPASNLCCENNLVGSTRNQCYSPDTHNCLPDQYVPSKNSLCPKGHYLGCNGVCYDSDLYICDANGQVRGANGEIIIRSTTLWNDQSVISSLNSMQTSWVAGANPSFVGKTVGQLQVLAGTFLENESPSVPSVARKLSTVQTTCSGCATGQLCCGSTCYNPSVHVCLDGNFLCPVGHYRCGNACYLPSQYGCFPGNFLCPVNHLPCGRACYRPDQYDCCDGSLARPGTCSNGGLPTNFNSINKWPNCINPIGNQGGCGSCWAFSATDVLGDRFCIHKNLGSYLDLSAQYQVSCDSDNYGCDGGYLDLTWDFLANTGVPTTSCVPYTGTDGTCPTKCADNSPISLNRAKSVMQLDGSDIEAVQQEIFDNGPIQAAFAVYNDFFFYTSGVYKYTSGALAGGHAVRVVGWGVEAGTNQPYWIVANSWGTGFGMSGYFWISRGNNEVGFESNMWRALPL